MASLDVLIFYVFLSVVTLVIARKKTLKQTLSFLGLTTKKFSWKELILASFVLFFIVTALLLVQSIILSALRVDDSEKVAVVISGLSLPAIIIATTIGPFAEELFFRGFLQKYSGV